MTERPKLDPKFYDGWHRLPGDGKEGDPGRRRSRKREFWDHRFNYWAKVENGQVVAVDGENSTRSFPKGSRPANIDDAGCLESWGTTPEDLLAKTTPRPDGWYPVPATPEFALIQEVFRQHWAFFERGKPIALCDYGPKSRAAHRQHLPIQSERDYLQRVDTKDKQVSVAAIFEKEGQALLGKMTDGWWTLPGAYTVDSRPLAPLSVKIQAGRVVGASRTTDDQMSVELLEGTVGPDQYAREIEERYAATIPSLIFAALSMGQVLTPVLAVSDGEKETSTAPAEQPQTQAATSEPVQAVQTQAPALEPAPASPNQTSYGLGTTLAAVSALVLGAGAIKKAAEIARSKRAQQQKRQQQTS